MMLFNYKLYGLAGVVLLGIFGISLIWKGFIGNVIKTIDREALFPRWMYVLWGIIVLIFPATWIIVRINN